MNCGLSVGSRFLRRIICRGLTTSCIVFLCIHRLYLLLNHGGFLVLIITISVALRVAIAILIGIAVTVLIADHLAEESLVLPSYNRVFIFALFVVYGLGRVLIYCWHSSSSSWVLSGFLLHITILQFICQKRFETKLFFWSNLVIIGQEWVIFGSFGSG